MPYVKPQQRVELRQRSPETPGELNYDLTRQIDRYIERRQNFGYATINEVIGVLECMKLELYRRVAAPYEDQKKLENGDVYTPQEKRK